MLEVSMQTAHIRTADLNLLPALVVLLEERSISRAAARHNLSQPAMSRVLQRLRDLFHDELLVRTANGYQPTERALALQESLPALLLGIDRELRARTFEPAVAEEHFRLCCSDFVARLLMPVLAERMSTLAPRCRLEVLTWHEDAFEEVTRGKVDVVLWANRAPPPLQSEEVIGTEMVCIVSARHPHARKRLTLEDYLALSHVDVAGLRNKPTIVDAQLHAAGHRRRVALRVPYFGSAIIAVQSTNLVGTMPRIAVDEYAEPGSVKVMPPPFKLAPISVLMSWHPSKTSEPASRWFRELVRRTARAAAQPRARPSTPAA